MFDRVREIVNIGDNAERYETNTQEVLIAFKWLIEEEGVIVDKSESDAIDEFSEIVERYDNIEPELQQARKSIGEGDEISLLDQIDNEQFGRWQEDHKHTVEEIKSLNEDVTELLSEINIDESRIDESRLNESGRFSEFTVFLERLNNAYRVFTYTSNK